MTSTQPHTDLDKTLRVALMAHYGNEIVAANLATNALLRFEIDATSLDNLGFAPFALWDLETSQANLLADPGRPELIEINSANPVGQLRKKRQIAAICNQSRAPENLPLLGFNGPSISYSQVSGNSPSITIVELSKRQAIRKNSYGEVTISFPWGPIIASLPLGNEKENYLFDRVDRPLNSQKEIAEILGFIPKYLVVVLAKPHAGYCKKVAAGLLPEKLTRKAEKVVAQRTLEPSAAYKDSSGHRPIKAEHGQSVFDPEDNE